MNFPAIKDLNLNKKRVFLRADLNVPLVNKKIIQDYKLKTILPTIDYTQQNGGKVILATHIGRPKAKSRTNFFDENLSTRILLNWFEQNGYQIEIEPDLKKAELLSKQDFSKILLLENLRFFNGEKEANYDFAQILAKLGDVYINDAFGVCHRNDTSVILLPKLFEKPNKAFGLLIEKEISQLEKLKENVAKPFVIVIGGCKIKDKIKMLQNLIAQPQENKVDSIVIGGAIANTFLKSQEYQVGQSMVEDDSLSIARQIINQAKEQNVKILLPQDCLSKNNEIKNYPIDKIPADANCLDIGPQTIKSFEKEILNAKTIFANGTMGIYTKKKFALGSQQILKAIANSSAFTVVGGGDAIAATHLFKFEDKMDFLSTGGGATLKFLASNDPLQELPGLTTIIKLFI